MNDITFTPSEDKPLVVHEEPVPRSCALCTFMVKQRISPTDLRQHLFCYRFPPTPVSVPTPQGLSVNSMHTPVQPQEWCFEFMPAVASRAVNA